MLLHLTEQCTHSGVRMLLPMCHAVMMTRSVLGAMVPEVSLSAIPECWCCALVHHQDA